MFVTLKDNHWFFEFLLLVKMYLKLWRMILHVKEFVLLKERVFLFCKIPWWICATFMYNVKEKKGVK